MEIMKSDNPKEWLKYREREMKGRFDRQLARYAGKNPLPAVIGNAFIRILENARNMKVRITFD